MTYLEWNNAIASFLFNEDRANQQVLLFLTKEDIGRIGQAKSDYATLDQAFDDFIQALKFSKDQTLSCPIEKALNHFHNWKSTANKTNIYPNYIGYLVLFVLPLTETYDSSYYSNNYYSRINDYFEKLGFLESVKGGKVGTLNFRLLLPLWTSLEEWSIMVCNFRLGYFTLTQFKNTNWKFVGPPLSQAIFPAKAINRLPLFFDESGLIPGEELNDELIQKNLLKHGKTSLHLGDDFLKFIRGGTELSSSILDIVRNTFKNWAGYVEISEDNHRRGYTVAQLRLCLEFDLGNNFMNIYYRVFSTNDYPEDLLLNEKYECKHVYKGWSDELLIPFDNEIKLEDKNNKWKVRTSRNEIRVLVPGSYYDFNGWVETLELLPHSQMILLFKISSKEKVTEWINSLKCKYTELNPNNSIVGHCLFKLSPPYINLNGIDEMTFRTIRQIDCIGGVKMATRTYLAGFLPELYIKNGTGNEQLTMSIGGASKEFILENTKNNTTWRLPGFTPINKDLFVRIKDSDEELKLMIIGYESNLDNIDEELLPKRDRFGQIINTELQPSQYAIGSKAVGIQRGGQEPYISFFTPRDSNGQLPEKKVNISLLQNDALLNMLTAKGKCNAKEYFESFEIIYNNKFSAEEASNHPELSRLKRWSLNLLDYMGFLDYEYSTKKIIVNSPQLIRIPTNAGRKMLLIGGRTPEIVDKIISQTAKENVVLEFLDQDLALTPYLLPTCITLSAFGDRVYEINQKIQRFAKNCDLLFDPQSIPQYTLAEFSGKIDDYESSLQKDERFYSLGLSCKKFSHSSLRFESINEDQIDKSFSLVEYRLNSYTYYHKLWKDGVSYSIDKNWGRYLILHKLNLNVICVDYSNNLTAVPSSVPLPRLIEESMTLFHGTAPRRRWLTLNGLETYYNIYENIPQIFAKNYFKKVGQNPFETQIPKS